MWLPLFILFILECYLTRTFSFTDYCIYYCRKIAPTILLDVPDDSTIMKEEIFGPLLPIVTVSIVSSAHFKLKACF